MEGFFVLNIFNLQSFIYRVLLGLFLGYSWVVLGYAEYTIGSLSFPYSSTPLPLYSSTFLIAFNNVGQSSVNRRSNGSQTAVKRQSNGSQTAITRAFVGLLQYYHYPMLVLCREPSRAELKLDMSKCPTSSNSFADAGCRVVGQLDMSNLCPTFGVFNSGPVTEIFQSRFYRPCFFSAKVFCRFLVAELAVLAVWQNWRFIIT